MNSPLVIAYHLIWTAYGWWLPNDPRGSGSTNVRSDVLKDLGVLHLGRKKVQPSASEVRKFYESAGRLLEHPLLTFEEKARLEIASAFAQVIDEHRYTCYACAIMPDHVHILIRKHKHLAEEMMEHFKDASLARLISTGIRAIDHPTWAAGTGWKVFLDHPDEIKRTIVYIRKNPLPWGLPIQEWDFVKPYDNWPLHEGHSPKSPYVRALKAAGRYP